MSQSGIWKTMWSFQIWIHHHEEKATWYVVKRIQQGTKNCCRRTYYGKWINNVCLWFSKQGKIMALPQIDNECIKDFYLTQWESGWDKTTESKEKKHLHISNGEVNSKVAFWTVGKGVLCNSNLIEFVWWSLDVTFKLLNGYWNVRVTSQQDDREGRG